MLQGEAGDAEFADRTDYCSTDVAKGDKTLTALSQHHTRQKI
jgi:hypothetical protein